jgi:hypothetical protein
MPVYLIQSGADGLVKIGFSNNVHLRFNKMQTDNSDKLTILRILDGGKELEAVLHARFSALKVRGEWFTFSKAMLGDIGAPGFTFEKRKDARKGRWSLERRAAAAAAQIALHADPARKESRARNVREAAGRRKLQRVGDLAKRIGNWQKMADVVGLPVTEVVAWEVIPVRFLEVLASAANVPVMKLSDLADRDSAA